jgi:hypothetical protein
MKCEPFYLDDGNGKLRIDLVGDAKRKLVESLLTNQGLEKNHIAAMNNLIETAKTIPNAELLQTAYEADVTEFEKILDWKGTKGGADLPGGIKFGGVQTRRTEWVLKPGAYMFIVGIPRKKINGMTISPDGEIKMIASINTVADYLRQKRSDDKYQMMFGYGLLVIGLLVLALGIFVY